MIWSNFSTLFTSKFISSPDFFVELQTAYGILQPGWSKLKHNLSSSYFAYLGWQWQNNINNHLESPYYVPALF